MGRKRRGWRSFSASQRSSGRLLAAAGDGGHGGVLSYWELFFTGGEGERPGRKGIERRLLRGVQRRLQEVASVSWAQAGGGIGCTWELHAAAPPRRQHKFAKSPFGFGGFPGKNKTAQILYTLMIKTCSRD
jgi:hypothetical protein